ncbi:hypothetical protein TI03_05530 [Achromatium sp. WMS1]|nr:hypothetical protein TI03_05530 [Achromatium sp. WMS1]
MRCPCSGESPVVSVSKTTCRILAFFGWVNLSVRTFFEFCLTESDFFWVADKFGFISFFLPGLIIIFSRFCCFESSIRDIPWLASLSANSLSGCPV